MESLQWPNAGSTTGFRGHCVLRESRRLQHLLLEQIQRHVAARTPTFPSITLRCWNHTIKAVQVKSTQAKIRDWSAISSQITQESEGMSPSLWNTRSDFCIKAWKLALQNYIKTDNATIIVSYISNRQCLLCLVRIAVIRLANPEVAFQPLLLDNYFKCLEITWSYL